MAFELKRKDVVNESGYKFAIGYCDIQHLLRYQDKLGYTYGVYGWNFDVYKIGDCVISTGYRGMECGENIPEGFELDFKPNGYKEFKKEVLESFASNLQTYCYSNDLIDLRSNVKNIVLILQ